jgi:hypothetical protein
MLPVASVWSCVFRVVCFAGCVFRCAIRKSVLMDISISYLSLRFGKERSKSSVTFFIIDAHVV